VTQLKTITDLLSLLGRLQEAKIYYTLTHSRGDALAIEVAVPGERWEIEILADGSTEIEIFRSNGEILDASSLDDLFRRFSD
jgi:hypothetical protein